MKIMNHFFYLYKNTNNNNFFKNIIDFYLFRVII